MLENQNCTIKLQEKKQPPSISKQGSVSANQKQKKEIPRLRGVELSDVDALVTRLD